MQDGHNADADAATQNVAADERLAVFSEHRSLLFSIAYRMLGSVADGEDMVQETFIRWQRMSTQTVHSPRDFLVTVISRLCINHLQSARARREEYVGPWLPEPLVTDLADDASHAAAMDESLSMAFLLLLERLTPLERIVFLLHEVFNFNHAAIAAIVRQSEANCRQILRRARGHVGKLRRRFRAPAAKQQELLDRFLEATRTGDLNALIALLSEDASLHTDSGGKQVAATRIIYGATSVASFILDVVHNRVPKGLVPGRTPINGTPGVIFNLNGKPFSVLTFAAENEGRIRAIYAMSNPQKLAHLQDFRRDTRQPG